MIGTTQSGTSTARLPGARASRARGRQGAGARPAAPARAAPARFPRAYPSPSPLTLRRRSFAAALLAPATAPCADNTPAASRPALRLRTVRPHARAGSVARRACLSRENTDSCDPFLANGAHASRAGVSADSAQRELQTHRAPLQPLAATPRLPGPACAVQQFKHACAP